MRYFILIVSVTALLLPGCSKKVEEKVIEKALEQQTGGQADVDLTDGQVNIKTKDGTASLTSGKNAKIPDDFPSDIYLYKGAGVKMAVQVPQGHSVVLTSKDAIQKVVDTYKKEMKANGWEQKAAMDMGAQTMLSFTKKERSAVFMCATENNETVINITAGKN